MPETSAPHILVVDDEPEVRAVLRTCFEMEGYSVAEASNGNEMRDHLGARPVNLITLDLALGSEDGLTLAREIRAQRDVPIIMVTGKGDMIDRVVGLELGADDYIAKPFHLREVLARVRSVLRRYDSTRRNAEAASVAGSKHEKYSFGTWVLDLTARELLNAQGASCDLTTAEFNLLELFVKTPQRALSRDLIMDGLKGHDWSPLDRSIDTLVGRLRKKIEPLAASPGAASPGAASPGATSPKLVKTVRGVGYLFAADVKRI